MGKLVVLTLGEGDFEQRGFPVTLQIGEEGENPSTQDTGHLPPNPEILEFYKSWQSTYRGYIGANVRLEANLAQIANFSIVEVNQKAKNLSQNLNQWLKSQLFSHLREELVANLKPDDEARFVIQTSDIKLRQLPWHLWGLLERYPKAEIGLSVPKYKRVTSPNTAKNEVNILAILGDSTGIDVEKDRAVLNSIRNTKTHFLVKPERKKLNDRLWEQPWDILFFAGHSRTQAETGIIYINDNESLTISELKFGLRKAIVQGLQLAIFNSCDGLGLAQDLADLNIPQIIVMREPVPDHVAQEFLKYFLQSFASGKSFQLSVREARERLQGLEKQFPCASWLPVIHQNLTALPISWENLYISQAKIARQNSLFGQNDVIHLHLNFKNIIDNPNILVSYRFNPYVLRELIGSGGSGLVYRAWNSTLGQQVCVKVFYPFKSEFANIATTISRGVRGLAGLNHPNIVKIFDFGRLTFDDTFSFYIVMEFVNGKTLDCWDLELPENDELLFKRLQIAFNLAMALRDAHKCKYIDEVGFEQTGVLHGDIKPVNILVRPDNSPVLIDFMMVDVQRLLDPKIVPPHLLEQSTPATGAFGTPGFMAPEQEREGIVTRRTDVYSLGVTFSYLFFPQYRYYPQSILHEHSNDQLKHLQALLREMLASNPEDRLPDMITVAKGLVNVASVMKIYLPDSEGFQESVIPTPIVAKRPNMRIIFPLQWLLLFSSGLAVLYVIYKFIIWILSMIR